LGAKVWRFGRLVGWLLGFALGCLGTISPPYIQPLFPKAAKVPFIMRLCQKNSLVCLVFVLPCGRSAYVGGAYFNLTLSFYVF